MNGGDPLYDSTLVKTSEVYPLPGSATESTDGTPLCMNVRVARLAVEATPNCETDFNVNATQLEESEETRRLIHKTLPRHVSGDKHDARQIAHLQSRSRSGETVDHAHRPQAATHGGEDRRGKDHLFSSNAAVPQYVKGSLASLGVGSSIFSHVGRRSRSHIVEATREAIGPTDRTRLATMRAVKIPVCNTPEASSANAGRNEQASQKVEKRSRTSRSRPRRGIGGTCLQRNARHGAELCVADNTPPCKARQDETGQEAVWTITQRPGGSSPS